MKSVIHTKKVNVICAEDTVRHRSITFSEDQIGVYPKNMV